jgi:ribosomal-protein-alanine N-acetyltransferase
MINYFILMNIELIQVKPNDWDIILDLRNTFYKMFYKQSKPISKNEHYEYLKSHNDDANFHHWMIKNNEQIVGYVRILQEDVGIMIKEEYQGKGIASRALELVIKESKTLGISKLIALVKPENIQSKRIFEKNNFEMKMYWYEKEII